MRMLGRLSERITPMLLLLLAIGLVVTPRRAGADRNCKPNRATCTANHQCCSGACTAGLCATPTTTSTTSTSTTSSTTTTTTSTTTATEPTTTSTTTSTTTTTLRFVDNGDGTVTDNETGLQWEQKDNTCPGIHCMSDAYTWCIDANHDLGCDNGGVPDGDAFTSFLATLNGGTTGVGNCVSSDGSSQAGGFANHCDWRLPTIAELQRIVDLSAPGCGTGTGPCIDQTVFGPTVASYYWSATTYAFSTNNVWVVFFRDGGVTYGSKGNGFSSPAIYVRAVR